MTNGTRDCVQSRLELQRSAVYELDNWFVQNGAVRLSLEKVRSFRRRSYTDGWYISDFGGDAGLPINVLIDMKFPWTPPSIFVDKSFFLQRPHVDEDGFLCVFTESATFDSHKSLGVAKIILQKTYDLISSEINFDDFRDEFLSYWIRENEKNLIRSLCNPLNDVRKVSIWHGKRYDLVADCDDDILNWLKNRRGLRKIPNDKCTSALLLGLETLPLPSEYPCTASDAVALIKRENPAALGMLEDELTASANGLKIVLSSQTDNGLVMCAVEICRPKDRFRGSGQRKVDTLQKGFRPGKVPRNVALARMLGDARCIRRNVQRIDPSWVHGRDQANQFDVLKNSRAVVIGLGSVGASVTNLLAKAGVGSFTLVDPDLLQASNVGRHELGIDSLGKSKTSEMIVHLQQKFPHLNEIRDFPNSWEAALKLEEDILSKADVIVSTIGDWKSEGALNLELLGGQYNVPAVYGWTEPYAAAGHAAICNDRSGCFACGVNNYGVPNLRVTRWDNSPARQEPACGTMFQPYGPVELSFINALIAQATLDVLTGNIEERAHHRVWCARKALVATNGGEWTDDWVGIVGSESEGGFIKHLGWDRNENCKICGRGQPC